MEEEIIREQRRKAMNSSKRLIKLENRKESLNFLHVAHLCK